MDFGIGIPVSVFAPIFERCPHFNASEKSGAFFFVADSFADYRLGQLRCRKSILQTHSESLGSVPILEGKHPLADTLHFSQEGPL